MNQITTVESLQPKKDHKKHQQMLKEHQLSKQLRMVNHHSGASQWLKPKKLKSLPTTLSF